MSHEEIRKIIRIGNSYAVTLPRPWIRYHKLEGKDKVRVVSGDTVVITPLPRGS